MVQDPGRKGGIDISGKKFNHDLKKKKKIIHVQIFGVPCMLLKKKKKTFRVCLEGG